MKILFDFRYSKDKKFYSIDLKNMLIHLLVRKYLMVHKFDSNIQNSNSIENKNLHFYRKEIKQTFLINSLPS
jgi:hypothetical protein